MVLFLIEIAILLDELINALVKGLRWIESFIPAGAWEAYILLNDPPPVSKQVMASVIAEMHDPNYRHLAMDRTPPGEWFS